MVLLYSFKKIRIEDLPKINRKKTPFFGVFRVSDSKFVSCSIKKEIKQLANSKEFGGSNFQDFGALSFAININATPVYERYLQNADLFTLLSSLERSIQVVVGATPIGYEVFFSNSDRKIKVRFYFLNFYRLTDSISVTDQLPKDTAKKLSDALEAKVANYSGLTLREKAVSTEDVLDVVELPEAPLGLSEIEQAAYEAATLMCDPYYRQAMARALRGLDKARAEKMMSSFNKLSSSLEVDIPAIELPKKHLKSSGAKVSAVSEVIASEDLDDIFS